MEAQPRFWKLFAYSVAPIALAVVIGLWLAGRIQGVATATVHERRTAEVIAQDRLLVDNIWSAIDTVKARALSLARIREAQPGPASVPEGPILHWAELEIQDGKLKGVRQSARNPSFEPSSGWQVFEEFYLQSALSRLDLHELQENGVTLLRIKQEQGHSQEWLALAFESMKGKSIVLALVDPVEVFSVFRRWASRSEGGNLRGYVVGSDGFVLVHSVGTYSGSDFRASSVFEQGVAPMLQGRVRNGAGEYKSIDRLPVTAAYARPGSLPLGVVVERVNPDAVEAGAWFASAPSPRTVFSAAAALCAALGLSALAALALGRLMRKASGQRRKAMPLSAPAAAFEPVHAPSAHAAPTPIDEEAPAPAAPLEQPELPELPELEDQVAHDLIAPHAARPRAQARHHARVLIAQFDLEAEQAADSKGVAKSLVAAAAKMARAPALFFGYRDSLQACLLEAHAELPFGTSTEALSFRLTDPMLARIARYGREGRAASLSDDPNLAILLARRLGQRRFDAWAVMSSEGRLLGVLAVLGGVSARLRDEAAGEAHGDAEHASQQALLAFEEGMAELMRASSSRYTERAAHA
jgi:hypothetical protein